MFDLLNTPAGEDKLVVSRWSLVFSKNQLMIIKLIVSGYRPLIIGAHYIIQ